MANYDIAYSLLKGNEGGWARVTEDSGGDTYAGFTKRDYPKLTFWIFLETQPYQWNKVFPELAQSVKDAYHENFWIPLRLDEVVDQNIANITFDMSVNKGIPCGIEFLQQSAGLATTGAMDDVTINGINNPTV